MTEAVKEKTQISTSFGIEADHPRNSDLLIQSIPGCRLRSAIDGSKPVIDSRTGDMRVPLDQSRHLAAFPKTPGMQLHVNPDKCQYMIIDPLNEDDKICDRIRRFLREKGETVADRIKGVDAVSGKLDIHRMKSLCRELYNIVAAGEAKVVKGVMPNMSTVDSFPGHYLLNPGSRVGSTQPIYEKDWDNWVATLSHSGG